MNLIGAFHIASLARSRANPARVNCFMRSNSSCNCLRPAAVSRYACFWRDGIFLLEALDPAIFKQAPQSAKQRAGAHADAAAAQQLNIFDQGVAVAGVSGQAGEDQQDGFGERLRLRRSWFASRHVA